MSNLTFEENITPLMDKKLLSMPWGPECVDIFLLSTLFAWAVVYRNLLINYLLMNGLININYCEEITLEYKSLLDKFGVIRLLIYNLNAFCIMN